jgi:hypothetical protein
MNYSQLDTGTTGSTKFSVSSNWLGLGLFNDEHSASRLHSITRKGD